MPGIAQFWQTLRPLRKVGKLRGVIIVPEFNEACGPSNISYYSVNSEWTSPNIAPVVLLDGTGITMEAWIKVPGLNRAQNINIMRFGLHRIELSTLGVPSVTLDRNAMAALTVTAPSAVPMVQWVHIAATCDGTNVYLYVNFELVASSALGGTLDTTAADIYIGDTGTSTGNSTGVQFNEVRQWNYARTLEQLELAAYSPRGSVDVGLNSYFPFHDGTGTTTIPNEITAKAYDLTPNPHAGDMSEWLDDDSYPYAMGASYYPLQFAIDTDGQYYSLKYPARKPYASVNFVPCIRWTEGGEVKRYRLWDAITGFDAAPEIPEYRGERIPDGSFLEIWNLDGNRTVLLTEAFDLETSILHVVENATTTARTSDATPVANTLLAEPFPLTPFPLQFDTQQTF